MFRKLTLFDYILVTLFVLAIVFFAYVFFRKPTYLTVTVKVGEDNILWPKPGEVNWFANLFYKGMKEKDGLGIAQAEVLKVLRYDTFPDRQAVYITLKLRTVYTRASNQYTYKGKPVLIGYPISLYLDSVNTDGIITNIAGLRDPRQKVNLVIEARTWDTVGNFLETTGIKPYMAEAVKKGDIVYDSNGNPVISVDRAEVVDAKMVVTTSSGNTLVVPNPLLKDLSLRLKVAATKLGGKYYVFDDNLIEIGGKIPINLPHVSVFPDVVKISEE